VHYHGNINAVNIFEINIRKWRLQVGGVYPLHPFPRSSHVVQQKFQNNVCCFYVVAMIPQNKHLPLFSKLRAVLHKTVARKIVKTVSSIKISHGWTETNRLCSSSSKISTSFFRLFILLNLKQLHTNTIKKLRYLYGWFGFDICTTFWPF